MKSRRSCGSSDSAEAAPTETSPPVPIPRVWARPNWMVSRPFAWTKAAASVSIKATLTSAGKLGASRATMEHPAPPRPTSKMARLGSILEAEHVLEPGKHALRSTDRRRSILNGGLHHADDARVFGLPVSLLLKLRDADAGGQA